VAAPVDELETRARKDDELVYGDDGFVYESEDEPEPQPIVVPASYVRELDSSLARFGSCKLGSSARGVRRATVSIGLGAFVAAVAGLPLAPAP
jgi:hypothetical protein